jgi:predicted neuraminidase
MALTATIREEKPMRLIMSACLCVAVLGGTAWSQGELQGELIFPAQQKHCHGSSIVQLPNGDFLACWFYGSGERSADDVLVQGARLKNGENQWSPVFEMADNPGFPDCNPVLFLDGQNRLWLMWIRVLANGWQNSLLEYRRAEDYQGEGAPKWNWQGVVPLKPGDDFPQVIEAGFEELDYSEPFWAEYARPYSELILEAARDKLKRQLGWMTRIHPLTLPSGRILLPLYSDGFNVSLVAITDDNGETWRVSKPIMGLGPIQPTLVRRNDGTVVAYMRDSGPDPSRVIMATSSDDGETWTVARDTDIPNPGSSLEVIRLKDGRWVMIFNDTESGRHQLALALSEDEGQTWPHKRYLEKASSPREGGFAYPSIIQAADGRLHATYTHSVSDGKSIKHVAVDPEWIKASGQ